VATFADTLEVWTNLQNAETLVVAIVELVRVWRQRSFTAILPDAFSVRPKRTRVQERRIRFPGIGVGAPFTPENRFDRSHAASYCLDTGEQVG
jgi:hypothetical protein